MQEIIKTIDGTGFKIKNFDLAQTFECGQCFRWNELDKDRYIGIVEGKIIEISRENDYFILNVSMDELSNKWIHYFDLKRDYSEIINKLSVDESMNQAIDFASGIRLLNQDEWETLISFIVSSNNNIPRIKKIIQSLCSIYGREIIYNDKIYHAFPTARELEGVTVEELKEIRCGYRASYIVDAVKKVNDGVVDLYSIKNLDTESARKELLKIKGVGPKVADCVLLFSMGKYDCYPMDVWIKKVTEDLYFDREVKDEEIKDFAMKYWGDYAGFAQQYLFHYARNSK